MSVMKMAGRPRRPRRSARAEREARRDTPLRRARTCYDHLAGVAGVALLGAILARGWLVRDGRAYTMTPRGADALERRGLDLDAVQSSARPFARPCADWTEPGEHLAGALGAAVLGHLVRDEVVRRTPRSRIVTLRRPLAEWLGA
jgi:hypothetical protein